jgi:hypothetical protein
MSGIAEAFVDPETHGESLLGLNSSQCARVGSSSARAGSSCTQEDECRASPSLNSFVLVLQQALLAFEGDECVPTPSITSCPLVIWQACLVVKRDKFKASPSIYSCVPVLQQALLSYISEA